MTGNRTAIDEMKGICAAIDCIWAPQRPHMYVSYSLAKHQRRRNTSKELLTDSNTPPYAERTHSRKRSITAYTPINERRRTSTEAYVHSQGRLAVNMSRRRLDLYPGRASGT